MRPISRLLFAIGLTLAASPAMAADPANVAESALGKVLVDGKGMTLYTFDKDTGGKSVCNGPCAGNWPPLKVAEGAAAGNWSMTVRDDGSKQWAYKGKPLYGWVKDGKPGDTTGEGMANGTWHVARP
jgi:predicted lipoprotein with Yx(FWY)xxD motif